MPWRTQAGITGRNLVGGTDGFIGPINHTVEVPVDLSALTNKEIDQDGYLKPYIPLTKGGALIGAQTRSTPGSATPGGGNVGNGTMGSATGGYGAPAETITLTITSEAANAGGFTVEGSVSGVIGTGTVGVAFTSPVISFTLADGSTDFDVDDSFTWTVTAGVDDHVYGVTVEHVKVADDNESATIAALSANFSVAVAIDAFVNKAYAEDVLGRSYTAAEVAGMAPGSSRVQLA